MISFNQQRKSIEDIVAIARGASIELAQDADFLARIRAGSDFLARLLAEDGVVYGVTTGYGDSCQVPIPAHLVEELPRQLYTFHGCGLGEILPIPATRAVLAVRLQSLCQGMSGVSVELLQQLTLLLQRDILPLIPQEGSVGASGDLTPLSYVAAVLCGERDVYHRGEHKPAAQAFRECAIAPLKLRPKEGLAIMNGTAVMTALACLAFNRAQYLAQLATRITALAVLASKGNVQHFDAVLFSAKPHPGQQQIAAWLREDLHVGEPPRNPQRLQDRYSLRCAPHVIGVLQDALPFFRQLIENEINSANDNPIVDSVGEHVLHGGHFYGGHIAFAMDSMKTAVANLADLLDRQLAMVVDPKFNHGLPANLSAVEGERGAINHGLKALQIGASAWTAEALKLTIPASVFSRSTECHNQDKVSMGTIAARDCLRIVTLTEQVAAAALLTMCQGLELRYAQAEIEPAGVSAALRGTLAQVRKISTYVDEDRALEGELRMLCQAIEQQEFTCYDQAT
jgi:histidine ammonia-lyase